MLNIWPFSMLADYASTALHVGRIIDTLILYSVVLLNPVHNDMHVKPWLRQVEDMMSIGDRMLCFPNNRETMDICFCAI